MSPPNGLEFDFGFSSLLDGSAASGNNVMNTNSNFASSLSDYGNNNNNSGNGSGAADYLSLSNLFDSHANNGLGNAMSTMNAGAPASWQAKKSFLDQQQQQLQQEQNSLNALLSQHTNNNNGNGQASAAHVNINGNVGANQGSSGNPFGFATREELEALASSANANSAQQNNHANTGNNGNNNNYMFVATIVDPNQEDAQPQQMLFLPGSNQVIPMPSNAAAQAAAAAAANGSGVPSMMALANLPVVFPQSGVSNNNSKKNTKTNFSLSLPSAADVTGNTAASSNWQQPQGFFGSLSNGFSSGLTNLEDAFSAHTQALSPATMDFSSSQAALAPTPMAAANNNNNNNNNAANNKAAMPVRPLSAYNFFFSDERERILHNKTEQDDVFDNDKKQRLLLAHLAKDRSKRRPHRKTHGKINFTTLSKLIGQRWKQLPDERKNFYREVAAIDLERYQRELRERSPASSNGTAEF